MSWEIILIPVILIVALLYRAKYVLISNSRLNELIQYYYDQNEFQIITVRKLNLNERTRYSAWNDLSLFIPYKYSHYRTLKETYFRVIEFSDNKRIEYQVYVEIQISKRQIVGLIEFDTYEI